ncbi:ArsR family transcriptional regulator [Deinococcus cavernae]|uniref:ArsR family transcriptional regulator n=1 Tax=Deinococcus cavernae TaxID=2320857 RepID=A0A418V898_9DEIO|nr:helix-turn-helix domain-containing protein [Deinococcus cavernae]RJF72333.1 ArsR family transcriptional regulator [Deinococcus cavernae]
MTPYSITTPEAANLLARPDVARLLKPFMRGPRTLSQVAQAQYMRVETLHYRVQQLRRAGLLRVVGEVPRRGRPLKLYEAVATAFVFSADLLSPEALQELSLGKAWLREFMEELERLTGADEQRTVQVSLNNAGALIWGTADELPERPEHPTAYFTQSAALYLTPAEAEELAAELDTLYQRYEGRSGPKRYGLILGLTPLSRPVD